MCRLNKLEPKWLEPKWLEPKWRPDAKVVARKTKLTKLEQAIEAMGDRDGHSHLKR